MAMMTRSELEQKPREELDTIAKAMGGKPSSRSRKADVVDLIMELVGPDNNSSAGGAAQAEAAEDAALNGAVGDASAGPGDPDDSDDTAPDADASDSDTKTARRSSQVRTFDYSADEAGHPAPASASDNSSDSQADSSDPNRRRRRRSRNPNESGSASTVEAEGYLDMRDEGYGFLRVNGHLATKSDVYVSVKQVKQFGLRKGDRVKGESRPSGQNEKNPALMKIESINGQAPDQAKRRPDFEKLTPLFPDVRLRLERDDDPKNMTTRIVDLLSPIGKGQRGLIVSPPKAGKTTIMKEIARSIELNNPEVTLIVLLVDERPEEVTDMRRWLKRPTSEVVASTFDRPSSEHTYIAELVLERAKRLVEGQQDVVIILDGITRLARAYNQALPSTGRLMSGGMDAGAIFPPKKFFGAARNVEEGGSLTILGTALVETGSKMDEVIFEEFKGTGNMELRLDRRSAERRIYPAIDVDASSTRHEELLFEREQLQQVWKLRRVLSGLASENDGNGAAGLELLIDRLKQFPSNSAFLSEVSHGQIRT